MRPREVLPSEGMATTIPLSNEDTEVGEGGSMQV